MSKALISCEKTAFPLNPGIYIKKAAAQERMAINAKAARGIVSFGSAPRRNSRGIVHTKNKTMKGNMENGVTKAPDKDDNSGKEVIGRPINPMAQKISQTFSKVFPTLLDATIMQLSR